MKGKLVVGLVGLALGIAANFLFAGGPVDCQSGTWGTVRWDRYIDSDGSIDERPNLKAGFDTVRLFICKDGSVRGRIDRTAPRR